MVKIGHAVGDERGRGSGGVAGDQTGKEVCVANWYERSWLYVLRPKSREMAEQMAAACEAGCANKNIGYDKSQRNTLHTEAQKVGYNLSKITTPCEADCSSFMTVCAIAGGVNGLEYTGNAPTTSNMMHYFEETGRFYVLKDAKYLKSDEYLQRGDIVVRPAGHTFMVLEDGSKVNNVESEEYNMQTIRKGSKGKAVKLWQIIVDVEPDGEFGAKTLEATKEFQKKQGLVVDGIVGTKSWKAGLESIK